MLGTSGKRLDNNSGDGDLSVSATTEVPTSANGSGARPDELLAAMAEGAEVRRLRRNDVLFRPGEPARELFVVRSGRIGVVYRAADGRESLVALVNEGELLGLQGLFDGQDRAAEARALEAASVLVIGYDPVRRLIEQRPALLWNVGKLLTGRLRAFGEALADNVFLDLTARTAKRILELSGDADEFQMPLTQEELAAMVGASRERVNKAIAGFVRLGWIHQRGRRYTIQDREALAKRAQG